MQLFRARFLCIIAPLAFFLHSLVHGIPTACRHTENVEVSVPAYGFMNNPRIKGDQLTDIARRVPIVPRIGESFGGNVEHHQFHITNGK